MYLLYCKHKRGENYLNAIKLEYENIDNISLQNVRIHLSGRCHEGKDTHGNSFPPFGDFVQSGITLDINGSSQTFGNSGSSTK